VIRVRAGEIGGKIAPAVSNRVEVLMVKRIAKEWLWLLTSVTVAIGVSLVYRGAWWTVGETGVMLASMYLLSGLVRTTIWAIRTAQRPAAT
jgi:hypothetical protein